MRLFLLLFPLFSFSQLHHEMMSSQGATKKISSGHYVTQTNKTIHFLSQFEIHISNRFLLAH